MKKFRKNLKAFTLAEMAIVFIVMGIVAASTIKIAKPKIDYYMNQYSSNSATSALEDGIGAIQEAGCTTNDVNNGTCYSEHALPIKGHTTDSRGLCDRLADLYTLSGTPNCNAPTTTSSFDSSHINFTTANGMRFFNLKSDASGNPLTYTVYIDIDGPKRNGVLNQDVMRYKIYSTDNGQFTIYYNDATIRSGITVYDDNSTIGYDHDSRGFGQYDWPSASVSVSTITTNFKLNARDATGSTVLNPFTNILKTNLKNSITAALGTSVPSLNAKLDAALNYAYNATYNKFVSNQDYDGDSLSTGTETWLGGSDATNKNRIVYYYWDWYDGWWNKTADVRVYVDNSQVIDTFLNYFDRYCAEHYGGTYDSAHKTTAAPTTTRGGTGGTGNVTALVGGYIKVEKY